MSGRERLGASFAIVSSIYRKELVDTLRDRRTLATMLLVPMVVYPLFVLVASEAYTVRARGERTWEVRVLASKNVPERIAKALDAPSDLSLLPFRLEDTVTATESLTSSTARFRAARAALALDADIVVLASTAARSAFDGHGTARFDLLFDETRSRSLGALERVRTALGQASTEMRDDRMRAAGLPPSAGRPLEVSQQSVASSHDVSGQVASMYLPMLMLFFVALSTFYPAVDLTAGEKERGTLATLLTMPIQAKEIVWGKYLAVVTVGTLAAFLNVGVITATLLRAVASASDRSLVPSYGLVTILELVVAAALLPILVGALMLVAASMARSFRDASNLLAPVMMTILMPAFLSLLPGVVLTRAWGMVPVANVVLLMKAILLDEVELADALQVALVTLVAAAATLGVASRAFADERVLFATEGRRAHFQSLILDPPDPGTATGFALAALMFAGQYFGGILVERGPALPSLVIVQVGVHGVPTLLLALWLRRRLRVSKLLGLGAPSARATGLAVTMGATAWLGVSLPILWAQTSLIGEQSELAKQLEATLGISTASLGLVLLATALVPALMEELAFRGMLLGLFSRRMSELGALVMQACLFAALHGSVFRLAPTAVLGMLLGYLRLRTGSIWPGVVVHGMTNAALVLVSRAAPFEAQLELSGPTPWALLALAAFAASLWLVRRECAA
ncbi:MAG: CPBP family intramembrane metalloprotease [Deltaproteobacteria bacterium]|nr:CPBP family intramembrane metalloprotease [Deltaproteobacteria bacterium]